MEKVSLTVICFYGNKFDRPVSKHAFCHESPFQWLYCLVPNTKKSHGKIDRDMCYIPERSQKHAFLV